MHIREEDLAVFKIKQRAKPPRAAQGIEELGRALVSRYATGRDQGDQTARRAQSLRTFDEQAVEVHVAAAEQRVVAAAELAVAHYAGVGLGALHRLLVLRPQIDAGRAVGGGLRHGSALQRGNHCFAVCRSGLRGNRRAALGKPLDLLQLDAVPRRVADDGVEAAFGADSEHGGEAGPPVEEGFLCRQFAGLCHQCIGGLRRCIGAIDLAGCDHLHEVFTGLQQLDEAGQHRVRGALTPALSRGERE